MAVASASMKQICNRNVSYEIELMEWCRKMDLIATSSKGDTIIHRFKWQKVWSHPAPEENLRVRAISWRNDDKMIGIGYSNGLVVLVDIESHEVIHSLNVGAPISAMSWSNNMEEVDPSQLVELQDSSFLTQLPSLSSLSSNTRKHDYNNLRFYSKSSLNVLLVGTEEGRVRLSAFGMLSCGEIDVKKDLGLKEARIKDLQITPDLRRMFVFVQEEGSSLRLAVYSTETLAKYSSSLLNVAIQHGLILNTLSYISDTIQSIVEAWETVLLEMDNKLAKYAESMGPDESLSVNFLELLMFGYPSSPAFLNFLTKDLTSKGLKKLGNSIDLSYSTIQKLVVKPLTCAVLNLLYHLSNLKGMSWNQYYHKNLLQESTEQAYAAAASFFIKTKELQQTIDTSTRDYKIFFRWLFSVITRLMEETVPEDIAAVRQQEINYLAEFIKNFDDINEKVGDGEEVKRKFNLERVGQYLLDKDLVFLDSEINERSWTALVEENRCLMGNPAVFKQNKKRSLVQELNEMKRAIDIAFETPHKTLGSEFRLVDSLDLPLLEDPKFDVTQTFVEDEGVGLFCVRRSASDFVFFETGAEKGLFCGVKVVLMSNTLGAGTEFEIRHVQFYNQATLSVLLRTKTSRISTYFMQFPVTKLRELSKPLQGASLGSVTTVNGYKIIDESLLKPIEGIESSLIAVSGSRKVASLLSDSRKTVRVYEMEVDEDDEEQLETSSLNVSMEN